MSRREQSVRPPKRVDVTAAVARHLERGTFRLTLHALDNMEIDGLEQDDVLEALRNAKQAPEHDDFSKLHGEWNYAIHGTDLEGRSIRVAVSFHVEDMVIVNVFAV